MPGHYSHLEAFYDDKKGVLPDSKGTPTSQQPVHWLPSIHRYMYPEMKVRQVLSGLQERAVRCCSLLVSHTSLYNQSLQRFVGCFRKDFVTWAVTSCSSLSLLCAGLAPTFRLSICACVPVSPLSCFLPFPSTCRSHTLLAVCLSSSNSSVSRSSSSGSLPCCASAY